MLKLLVALPHTLFLGLAGILGFGLLVVVHEFGHFFFCKLFGVRTPTFSVGFGPKLFTKKIGDTEFALSAIPLGGYVEIAGLAEVGQGEQKEAQRTDTLSFSQKPYYQKFLILIGGIFFNLLFALSAFWLVFMLGLPKNLLFQKIIPTISQVAPDSPAAKAGLKACDTIVAVNGTYLEKDAQKLTDLLRASSNRPLILRIERPNTPESSPTTKTSIPTAEQQPVTCPDTPALAITTLDIAATPNEQGLLGIALATEPLMQPALTAIAALKKAAQETWHISRGVLSVFSNLLRGRDLDKVTGPLSIFEATIKGAGQGISIFLFILALISINLAIINLIPLPIADGGQILIQTIEAIIRREIPLRIKEFIFMACWILFILLTLYMSAKDVMRMAGNTISTFFKSIGTLIANIFTFFKK